MSKAVEATARSKVVTQPTLNRAESCIRDKAAAVEHTSHRLAAASRDCIQILTPSVFVQKCTPPSHTLSTREAATLRCSRIPSKSGGGGNDIRGGPGAGGGNAGAAAVAVAVPVGRMQVRGSAAATLTSADCVMYHQ